MTRPCLVPSCPRPPEGRRVFCDRCWKAAPSVSKRALAQHAAALNLFFYESILGTLALLVANERDTHAARSA